MARLALALGGAVAGNALLPGIGGNIGFALGSAAGAFLFPETLPDQQGPRLEDAAITTSAYGKTLAEVWGIYPIAGNVMDASPVREVSTTEQQGGKGGGSTQSTTTYQYFGDLAVAICEGEIDAVLQIRANGQLIFDSSPTASVVQPPWLKFRLYTGSEDQNPDPVLEATHGAGNVPAYRGTAYVVFEDFAFSEFGNNFAISFEFLVARDATSSPTLQSLQIAETGEDTGWRGGLIEPATGLLLFPTSEAVLQTYALTAVDPYSRSVVWKTPETGASSSGSISLAVKPINTPTGVIGVPGYVAIVNGRVVSGYKIQLIDAESGAIVDDSPIKATGSTNIVAMAYDWHDVNAAGQPVYIKDRGSFSGYDLYVGFDTETQIDPPGVWKIAEGIASNGAGQCLVFLQDADISPTAFAVALLTIVGDTATWSSTLSVDGWEGIATDGSNWYLLTKASDADILVIDSDCTLSDTIDLSADYSITDAVKTSNGDANFCSLFYEASTNSLFFHTLNKVYQLGLSDLTVDPIEYSITGYDPVLYHAESARYWWIDSNSVNAYSANLLGATGTTATLDNVVSDLTTNDTQLTASDINVTALSGTTVRGFAVARRMARRNALQALQQAYFFDFVPRSGKLTGILRGAASAATLDEDKIGAYVSGGQPPPPWTIKRAAGESLPNQVTVEFIDPDHNYEPGSQIARRQATTGGSTASVTLPVILNNDEAAQVADKLLHLAHIEAEQYETTTMPSTIDDVEPGAVITVSYGGVLYVLRVIEGSVIDGRMISVRGAREVPEVFTSYAVGGDPRGSGSAINLLGNTLLWPLDIPTLRQADNAAGVYLAAASYTPGWPGCTVQRSVDGSTWVSGEAQTNATTMGNVLNVPAVGQVRAWNTTATITVRLIDGTLSSTTRDAPTYAAWGEDGRYEIIAFITASQETDGTWSVTDYTRGLLDTDDAMTQHAAGDRFVVLTANTVGRLSLPLTSIDGVEFVRGVTIGRTADSAPVSRYPFAAVGLEPFRPARLDATRDGSDNWDIAWQRQDRIIGRPFWDQANVESSETYILTILNASEQTVRTETITDATTYEYTAAQQVTDFGIKQTDLRFQLQQVGQYTGGGNIAAAFVGQDFKYLDTIIDDGALLIYPLDELSGTTAENIASGSYDGSYVGSPTLGANGVMSSGNSVDLSGSSQYVSVVNTALGNGWSRSLEFAFNCDALPSSGEMAIIGTQYNNGGSPADTQFITVTINSSGVLIFRAYGFGSSPGPVRMTASGTALSAGTSYHVVINHTSGGSGTATVYVDGVSYATASSSGNWDLQSGWIYIGYSPVITAHADFDGRIDNVSFWSSTQGTSQITDHYTRSGI